MRPTKQHWASLAGLILTVGSTTVSIRGPGSVLYGTNATAGIKYRF